MSGLTLLPVAAGRCAHCASLHGPDDPHDMGSVFYGMRFLTRHGRDATYADAVAHLSPLDRESHQAVMEHIGLTWTEPDGEPISEPYVVSPGLCRQQE